MSNCNWIANLTLILNCYMICINLSGVYYMNYDLKKIKKYYGEEMMHLCRELFPTILEEEGALLKIMEETFPHSRYLYDDIVNDDQITKFKDFIYEKYNAPIEKKTVDKIINSPFELMDKAGYTLYECHSEDDIQKFRKYYAKGEELCSFAGGRLNTSLVFFAVKKNVCDIKRENFKTPERQDEYGTSVISIQYRRGERNTLSVKNRYNHTVDNPDATFSNNLDNIIDGLNDSFERTYNLSHTGSCDKFELTNYVRTVDGKYYKYNYEINDVYYGPDNTIIDNYELVKKYQEKEKYFVIDYFIVDLINKRIYSYDNSDKYIEGLNDIDKIDIFKVPNTSKKSITLTMNNKEKVSFEVNKYNRIIKLEDNYTTMIPDGALLHSAFIKEMSIPKAVKCGDRFLFNDSVLNKINMPEIRYVGDDFLRTCIFIKEINFPKLEIVGNYFMRVADMVKVINLPSLVMIGDYFMDLNRGTESIYLPNVKTIGCWFMASNNRITTLEISKLEKVEGNFLSYNRTLNEIKFPELISVGNCFFMNSKATKVELPKVIEIGNRFMYNNIEIENITLPNVIKIGDSFLGTNTILKYLSMPNLVIVGNNFLYSNKKLTSIYLPNLELCGDGFLMYNNVVSSIYIPKIECLGVDFLRYNLKLRNYVFENMERVETENGMKLVRKR